MVLLGNSTQTNCSRANAVVSLSGKEQISPILLLTGSAPDGHHVEQSRMASATRTSLRSRKRSAAGEIARARPSHAYVDGKKCAGEKQASPHDASSYFSLVDYLSKSPCDSLPLEKNGISSAWTCGQCCQTFLSNSDFQVHLSAHHTMSVSPGGNHAQSVIAIGGKKRQSSEEPAVRKRLKRSSSPDQVFVFDADRMQAVSSNGEKFYKCDICDQLYASADNGAFKIHYLRSHINYQFISSQDRALCSIVDDGLKSKVTDFLYRCYFCNISCADKQSIVEHNLEHKSNVFRCEHCHSVFYQNKAFTNHVKNCGKTVSASATSILCLHCKEPRWFEDRDTHTREYHCYSNGIIRVECVFGCVNKTRKLCELFKHYASVHRDVYFSCVPCKVRFVTIDELNNHNRTKHNLQVATSDVNHVPKKSKMSKSTCDTAQAMKLSAQTVLKSNAQTVAKSNAPATSKPNGQASSKSCRPEPPDGAVLSPQQQHLRDILFKAILKLDLTEQVRVLRQHAVHYPGLLRLPAHPVFAPGPAPPPCPCPGEEEFQFPVFSSPPADAVFICKACGRQCAHRDQMTAHMTAAHPHIHNEYFVFAREDLPTDFWSLSHPPDARRTTAAARCSPAGKASAGRHNGKGATWPHKCSCCAFECKDDAEFHKHLLQCAQRQTTTSEKHIRSKAGPARKPECAGDSSRRRMVITGVLRQVPDDILFSYKKELEKTIRKPGDSETVFNMLNKLPSKRLVKTTERYDSLYYKNNKAMKPKPSANSMERVAQFIHEKDPSFSLSDYLKYFIHRETPIKQRVGQPAEAKPLAVNKATSELVKVVDKKIKVKSKCDEELCKIFSDKKIKVKTSPAPSRDTKVTGDRKAKSPKQNHVDETACGQPVDNKKVKVPKSNLVDERKSKLLRVNGACGDEMAAKLNGVHSASKKLQSKESVKKEKCEPDTSALPPFQVKREPNNVACRSLQNVKVVPIHYPTLTVKASLLAHTKCSKPLKTPNTTSNKNVLVEMKGKNVNASVRKKGKTTRQVVRKKLVANKKATKLNGLMKMPPMKTKLDSNSEDAAVASQLSPRQKHTSSYVVISDAPLLLPLPATKREKPKKKS